MGLIFSGSDKKTHLFIHLFIHPVIHQTLIYETLF